ncbi:unnamed protein product [Rotaria sp. Silwood1]|nr:unnamed protein product [Rotaria sp. Silwood1]
MSSIHTTTDEEEPIVTCSELLEQIEDEEDELDRERALYGNCDVDTCTYSQGYVRRQPLFACMTCNNNGELSGVCAACAYHCHANHDVNELFFRCDCGNSKLTHQPCKLYPNKDAENILNKYNDNFRGIYCTCKRSYPDKEKEHLGVPLPMEENDINQMDMICQACIAKYKFLANYDESRGITLQPSIDNNAAAASNNQSCLLPSNANTEVHTIFLRDGWRKRLCRCVQCSKLYDELNLTPIFDDDDAIQEYEKQALAKSENLDADKIIADSLENLGYVRKLEVLHDINEFKKSLGDFLREKADSDGVLTAEDVTTFFANLKDKRKEQQRTTFMPPDNCKF